MFRDKTILITGAAGGLGRALAQTLLESGGNVVLLDKDLTSLERVYDEAADSTSGIPVLLPVDLSRAGPDDYSEISGQINAQFGQLDALVHTAVAFDSLRLLEQVEPNDWFEQIQVNLTAPWMLTNACLPQLRKADNGTVLFLLEQMEKVDGAFRGAYGISKHALRAMVKMYGQENADITVLGINPGPMRTTLRQKFYYAENPEDQPVPEVAAQKIADILAGETPVSQSIFDL